MASIWQKLNRQAGELEVQIQAWHRSNACSCKLEQIPGIGLLTASALAASIGEAKNFANDRQLAAWLGLVPKQHSTGGRRTCWASASAATHIYLRTLLIHGARAVIRQVKRKPEAQGWLHRLIGRHNKNVAAVALANKNARIVFG